MVKRLEQAQYYLCEHHRIRMVVGGRYNLSRADVPWRKPIGNWQLDTGWPSSIDLKRRFNQQTSREMEGQDQLAPPA